MHAPEFDRALEASLGLGDPRRRARSRWWSPRATTCCATTAGGPRSRRCCTRAGTSSCPTTSASTGSSAAARATAADHDEARRLGDRQRPGERRRRRPRPRPGRPRGHARRLTRTPRRPCASAGRAASGTPVSPPAGEGLYTWCQPERQHPPSGHPRPPPRVAHLGSSSLSCAQCRCSRSRSLTYLTEIPRPRGEKRETHVPEVPRCRRHPQEALVGRRARRPRPHRPSQRRHAPRTPAWRPARDRVVRAAATPAASTASGRPVRRATTVPSVTTVRPTTATTVRSATTVPRTTGTTAPARRPPGVQPGRPPPAATVRVQPRRPSGLQP